MIFQMKNIRFAMPCMMLLICFSAGLSAQSSSNEPTAEDRPFIDKLSVDPLTGRITISWDMPPTWDPERIDPDRFLLHWYYRTPGGVTHPTLDTIRVLSARPYSYEFDYNELAAKFPELPDPRTNTVAFTISAIQGEAPDEINTMRSIPHNNLHLTSRYDSCRAEIRLNWNRYTRINPDMGWLVNTQPFKPLVNYRVMRIPENGTEQDAVEIRTLSESDTTFVIMQVPENDKFTFFVKARRSDGVEVSSYRTVIETNMPIPPKEIIAVGTRYNEDGFAEISFKIDPDAETFLYQFLGSRDYNYSFVSMRDSPIHIRRDTTLIDANRRRMTYYYKLEAWHICRNRYIDTKNNMATALWLQLKQDPTSNLLFWDSYADWGGQAEYRVYRQIGDHPEEIVATLTETAIAGASERIEFIDDLEYVYIDGEICYWIVASPVSPNLPDRQEVAISNKYCIKPESNIFVPQAFTPGAPGLNGEFRPFFSYPPEEYLFIVYDRNGAPQFETNNAENGWNGRLMNGRPASEGVYTYYVRFRTAMGRLVHKRGTFILIMP